MIETKRRLRVLIVCIAVSALVNLAGTVLFIVSSYNARQENCRSVEEAFDAYTTALAQVTDAAEATVREFRNAYQPSLEECH